MEGVPELQLATWPRSGRGACRENARDRGRGGSQSEQHSHAPRREHATNLDERESLGRNLADKNNMLLVNHGSLSVGRTIPHAFRNSYVL
mgnify:CR=1 FL=1